MNQESDSLPNQLPLGIRLPENIGFDSFVAGPNTELIPALRDMVSEARDASLYLWGQAGSGKSHLLQALCREAGQRGVTCAYLPLADTVTMTAGLLQGMEFLELICIDDMDAIAGKESWERALFDLFNRTMSGASRLVMAGSGRPDLLGLHLPDLVSRLNWGPVYPVKALDDAGRLEVLQLRAKARGFELPDDTAQYLLRHYPRDLHALCALLDRLDHASLVAQRRLTIPFVKSALES